MVVDINSSKGLGISMSSKMAVLYSTYATLTSNYGKKESRFNQMIKWCGGVAFDGCIMFDECHKAKNCDPQEKKSPNSKVALAVQALQRELPNARVVYCSATGVNGIEQLAYMTRLGLWGEATSFSDFTAFQTSIKSRGMGALELLAIDLKTQGKYVSRGLSYEGAEFSVETIPLEDSQREIYKKATSIWIQLRQSLKIAIRETRTAPPVIWTLYWSFHQRFFRQLCMCVKVPKIVPLANESLANGHSVVIGLQTTGEASMSRVALNKPSNIFQDAKKTTLVSICAQIVLDFVNMHFPVINAATKMPTLVDFGWAAKNAMDIGRERGMNRAALDRVYAQTLQRVKTQNNRISLEHKARNLDAGKQNTKSLELRNQLLQNIDAIQLPPNPLDDLIDQLGGLRNVAELTGRKSRYLRGYGGGFELCSRGVDVALNKVNALERNKFMNGVKKVAIISDAASTGISLHADNRAKNRCKRIHITLELPWSADKAIQQLGRTHRSNQLVAPTYKLVTTNLGGENSFVSRVAKKMLTLGAITKGDRRAGTGQDFSAFNYDTKYGKLAVTTIISSIQTNTAVSGVNMKDFATQYPVIVNHKDVSSYEEVFVATMALRNLRNEMEPVGLFELSKCGVKTFFNRLLGIGPDMQNALFYYFESYMNSLIATAQQEGKYDEGYEDIHGRETNLLNTEVLIESSLGRVQQSRIQVDRGVSWREIVEVHNAAKGDSRSGEFRLSRNRLFGEFSVVYVQPRPLTARCTVIRPNTGWSSMDQDYFEIKRKYYCIDLTLAEKHWHRIFNDSESHCIHWNGCKQGEACTVGIRRRLYNVLFGSILAYWKILEKLGFNFSAGSSELKILRISLNQNERIVGIHFPPCNMETLKYMLTEEQKASVKSIQTDHISTILASNYKNALQAKTSITSFFQKRSANFDPFSNSTPKKIKSSSFFQKACTPGKADQLFSKKHRPPLVSPRAMNHQSPPVVIVLDSSSDGE